MKAFLLLGLLMSLNAYADETLGEKVESAANDVKRAVRKGANRVEEAVCSGSDTKCAQRKIENRAEEASDFAKDKVEEVKNKID